MPVGFTYVRSCAASLFMTSLDIDFFQIFHRYRYLHLVISGLNKKQMFQTLWITLKDSVTLFDENTIVKSTEWLWVSPPVLPRNYLVSKTPK